MIIPSSRRVSDPRSTSWARWVDLPGTLTSTLSIHAVSGRLFVGYGDWTANDGPRDVISVGTDGELVTHLEDSPTEAFNNFREIDGWVYGPLTDPKGTAKGGYVTNEGGEWHTHLTDINMVHAFDICRTSHGLWLTGSARSIDSTTEPIVALSKDDGTTWTEVKVGVRGSVNRYYGILTVGDAVHVMEPDGGPIVTTSDGGQTWHESPLTDRTVFSDYGRPDAYRVPNPTAQQKALRDWRVALPYRGKAPVVIGRDAYCLAGSTIYRRPAPEEI